MKEKGYWIWLFGRAKKLFEILLLAFIGIFSVIPKLLEWVYNEIKEIIADTWIWETLTAMMGTFCGLLILVLIVTLDHLSEHPDLKLHLILIVITFLLSTYGWYRSVTIIEM